MLDPGAASGIIGTDTLREYQEDVLSKTSCKVKLRPSTATFTSIDGKPTKGLGSAAIPLPKTALKNGVFVADLIGGAGSLCPGLLPLSSFLAYKANIFCNVF